MAQEPPRQGLGEPWRRSAKAKQPAGTRPRPDLDAGDLEAGETGHASGRREPRILGLLLGEIERRVRDNLAEHLRRCPYLPSSLALTLAGDIETAGGPPVGPVGTAVAGVLERLLGELSCQPQALIATQDGMRLSLAVMGQAILELSEVLQQGLMDHHGLPAELAEEMAMHGRERALSRALAAGDPTTEVDLLVDRLLARHALTPTLMLRSLCLGRLHFFASALAALADVPVFETKALIFGGSVADLLQLYEKSGLPLDLFRAFRTTIEMICGLNSDQISKWQRAYTNRIIARLVNEYDHVCPEDLEHVMSQLTRPMTEQGGSSSPPRSEGSAG